jgi:hypothetical protein
VEGRCQKLGVRIQNVGVGRSEFGSEKTDFNDDEGTTDVRHSHATRVWCSIAPA